jgi:hypothetical protein
VTLRLANGNAGADVAGNVMLAMAVAAELPPLLAERTRERVTGAMRACDAPAEIDVAAAPGRLRANVATPAEHLAPVAERLAELGPVRFDDHIELVVMRPPLERV